MKVAICKRWHRRIALVFALVSERVLLRITGMNTKLVYILAVAGALAVGAVVTAQTGAKPQAAESGDSRIGKLLEQNEQILKNQQEILQKLDTMNSGIQQLRRRGS